MSTWKHPYLPVDFSKKLDTTKIETSVAWKKAMRKSKLTANTIPAVLGEGEAGLAVVRAGRKHPISVATYHQWRGQSRAVAGANQTRRVARSIYLYKSIAYIM